MSLLNGLFPIATDSEGRTLPKALLYSYDAGTNTPKVTYSDSALTIPNANPLEADGSGWFENVYLGAGGYKFVLRDKFDAVVKTQDNYYQALDGTDLTNINAAIAAVAQDVSQSAAVYTDSGAADAYVLTISSNATAPTAYHEGMLITFIPDYANTGASTVNVSTLGNKSLLDQSGSALSAGFLEVNRYYTFIYQGGNFRYLNRSGLISYSQLATDVTQYLAVDNSVNDFRITLTSGTPVTTSDVTAATVIYMAPYNGNRISLYDGSKWLIYTTAEIQVGLGTITNDNCYDVFCYLSSGTPTLELLAWTNNTTRATALAYQDGVLVKSGATTRRYLGTILTTSATTTEDSESKRYVFNFYNRVNKKLYVSDATATWAYTTATWRQARATATNQVHFVVGYVDYPVTLNLVAGAQNATGASGQSIGIGLNTTTAPTSRTASNSTINTTTYASMSLTSTLYPTLGKNYAAWLEYSVATGTSNWVGTSGQYLSGMSGFTPC